MATSPWVCVSVPVYACVYAFVCLCVSVLQCVCESATNMNLNYIGRDRTGPSERAGPGRTGRVVWAGRASWLEGSSELEFYKPMDVLIDGELSSRSLVIPCMWLMYCGTNAIVHVDEFKATAH
jgi:hypothetical protein